ncbi:glycosyltransferase [Rhodobacterales bacterium LSUCC0031]|nr:glycosyltransferase [Rhodobacterales bacterium LSUCC0031]
MTIPQAFDLLYIFNFEPKHMAGALSRFRHSLESICRQGVRICVSNNSAQCIESVVRELCPDVCYVHQPYNGPFSRAHAINFGVRSLVRTPYFIVSDVDLVYRPQHIATLAGKLGAIIERTDRPVRLVTYNYNLSPVYCPAWMNVRALRRFALTSSPGESSDYEALLKLPNNGGDYAHGNGVIHLESFLRLRGYDENMIGYGPEDDLFNCRIGKVNELVYDPDPQTASIHLWHPRLRMIQHRTNMRIWWDMKAHYNSLDNPGWDDVTANRDQDDWGIIK